MLPIDDRAIERFNPALAGRPDLMAGRTSLTVYEGMTGMTENVFINVKNRSHTITADVEIPAGGANGVILCQGGRFGGWSLYVKDGKPAYTYNFVGLQEYTVNASRAARARQGDDQARLRLRRQRPRQRRNSHDLVNGKKVGIRTRRANQCEHLLGRRCRRCGRGRRNQREFGIQATATTGSPARSRKCWWRSGEEIISEGTADSRLLPPVPGMLTFATSAALPPRRGESCSPSTTLTKRIRPRGNGTSSASPQALSWLAGIGV